MSDHAVIWTEWPHASALYREAVALRQQVLRTPLKMSFSEEDLAAEGPPQRHVGGILDGKIVASACFLPVENGGVKVRQVAVAEDRRGHGLGRELMHFTENLAAVSGATWVTLHARLVVMDFYLRLGYAPVGEEFVEVGLPHVEMQKRLA